MRSRGSLTGVEKLENPRLEIAQREGATQTADVKGKIIEFAWWLKKQGCRESTISGRTRLIATLAKRGADLSNPETIKEVIARQTWSEGRKDLTVDAYTSFLKMTGGKWAPPRCNRIQKNLESTQKAKSTN